MSATGPNALGCYPHNGECLVHDAMLICAAGCHHGDHAVDHERGTILDCGAQQKVLKHIRDFNFEDTTPADTRPNRKGRGR